MVVACHGTMSSDTIHMARALALAERGRGRTSPNPMVGAVVVDDEGVVVGRGAHEFAGGPHAEILALRRRRATGARRDALLHARAVQPHRPDRAVRARKWSTPASAARSSPSRIRIRWWPAGAWPTCATTASTVAVGVLREAAERLNAPFLTVMRRQRPFVTMKVALSRDGCVAGAGGHRLALTGPSADRCIHRERAEVDAIGVGSGTHPRRRPPADGARRLPRTGR